MPMESIKLRYLLARYFPCEVFELERAYGQQQFRIKSQKQLLTTVLLWRLPSLQGEKKGESLMMLIGVTVTVNIVTSVWVKGGRDCWCYILGYTVTTETSEGGEIEGAESSHCYSGHCISTSEGGEIEGDESSHCFCRHWHLYE